MKTHQSSMTKTVIAPIAGTLALILLIAGAAAINLNRETTPVAKPAHHMASLAEIKALMDRAHQEQQ